MPRAVFAESRRVSKGPQSMKALTFHGKRDVRVDTVPDPTIEQPTDVVIRVTSTRAVRLGPAPLRGARPVHRRGRHPRPRADGHRRGGRRRDHRGQARRPCRRSRSTSPAGTAGCAGTACSRSARRRRCASRGWARRCSATPSSTARSPAARPSSCACRRPSTDRSRSPTARRTTASCSSATCCRPPGRRSSTRSFPTTARVVVIGLGPIGEMSTRIAQHLGAAQVIGLDLVPERLARAQAHGVHTLDVGAVDDVAEAVRELTGGRGPDAVIDAVGMEAHGAPGAALAHKLTGLLPDAVARAVMQTAGVDRLSALQPRGRARPPRRHDLALRRLRRHRRPAEPAADVRQAADAEDGPGQRPALDRRHHAAARARRRPARRRHLRHPPPAADRGARGLRDVPEEAGRRVQGRLPAGEPERRARRGDRGDRQRRHERRRRRSRRTSG